MGIITQAWSPIGGIRHYRGDTATPLTDSTIQAIADGHGKTTAQVMIRWHIQRGRSAIPKSVRRDRITENFNVFDFELTTDELVRIDDISLAGRRGQDLLRASTAASSLSRRRLAASSSRTVRIPAGFRPS